MLGWCSKQYLIVPFTTLPPLYIRPPVHHVGDIFVRLISLPCTVRLLLTVPAIANESYALSSPTPRLFLVLRAGRPTPWNGWAITFCGTTRKAHRQRGTNRLEFYSVFAASKVGLGGKGRGREERRVCERNRWRGGWDDRWLDLSYRACCIALLGLLAMLFFGLFVRLVIGRMRQLVNRPN